MSLLAFSLCPLYTTRHSPRRLRKFYSIPKDCRHFGCVAPPPRTALHEPVVSQSRTHHRHLGRGRSNRTRMKAGSEQHPFSEIQSSLILFIRPGSASSACHRFKLTQRVCVLWVPCSHPTLHQLWLRLCRARFSVANRSFLNSSGYQGDRCSSTLTRTWAKAPASTPS